MEQQLTEILSFAPNLHKTVWGGDTIPIYKGIITPCDCGNIGESWEISAVPGSESEVNIGPLKGTKLNDLVSRYGASLLGTRVYERYGGKFPILVKLIDAAADLSIQVHPDDDLALKRHNSMGKTEMWYVIATRPNSNIKVGLKRQLTPEQYEQSVKDGDFADEVATYSSHPGDSFFIPAGRVHAICAGNLLAEIQESSDITYRIFDYNRPGTDGKPRQLHVEEAKDAIDFTVRQDYRNHPTPISPRLDDIVSCNHFDVKRLKLDGPYNLKGDSSTFMCVMCLEGSAMINADGNERCITHGDTLLIPAAIKDIKFDGDAIILLITA